MQVDISPKNARINSTNSSRKVGHVSLLRLGCNAKEDVMTHPSHLILSDQSNKFAGTAAKVPQDILKCVAEVRVRMLDVTGLEVFGARVLHVRLPIFQAFGPPSSQEFPKSS